MCTNRTIGFLVSRTRSREKDDNKNYNQHFLLDNSISIIELFSEIKMIKGVFILKPLTVFKTNQAFSFKTYSESELNEFETRLKSAINRFQLSAGLNLKTLNTI